MKRYVLLTILITTFAIASPIHWAPSLSQAIVQAKASHKGIMIFVEAKNCPYCEQMKSEVLSKPYMAHALNKFISVKLDITSKDVKRYFPDACLTPTIYFVTPGMKVLDHINGAVSEEFFFWHEDAAEKALK